MWVRFRMRLQLAQGSREAATQNFSGHEEKGVRLYVGPPLYE